MKCYARPGEKPAEVKLEPIVYALARLRKNKSCPCGSQAKFKNCCLGRGLERRPRS